MIALLSAASAQPALADLLPIPPPSSRIAVGHQMAPLPRYGTGTPTSAMREEVAQWKDLGLDGILVFDVANPTFQDIAKRYHEAALQEGGFKIAISPGYVTDDRVADHIAFLKSLADPKYAGARLMKNGEPYVGGYHTSSGWAAALPQLGFPVYFEPQVFPRVFSGDPNTQGWEGGGITSTTPANVGVLMDHPAWKNTTDGIATFYIGASLEDQATGIDTIWNEARKRGKTARGSIVAHYKGYAHKGNWMVYESWGFARLQGVWKRAIDSGIPAVELITLNDMSESSYFNSWGNGDPAILVNHWNSKDNAAIIDHSGFRYFSKRYVQWYKTGVEPAITQDELYYAYRLHPRNATSYYYLSQSEKNSLQSWIPAGQPADIIYRKDGLPNSPEFGGNATTGLDWRRLSDGIHAAVRLVAPADVYINGVKIASLPAGEHLVTKPGAISEGASSYGYPLYTFGPSDFGYPTFEIRRNGQTVIKQTGELEITAYPVPGCWNMFARKAPGPSNPQPAPLGVSLSAPANGQTFTTGASVTLSATLTGDTSKLAKVEFYDGLAKIGERTAAPYSISWTVTAGVHLLTARALDTAGVPAISAAVSITVSDAPSATPTPTITAPAAGTTFTAGAAIAITASLQGDASSVMRVEFIDGSTKLGEKTSSPWTFTWSGAAVGAHSLTAKCVTNSGASATSAAVSITVASAPLPSQRSPYQDTRASIPGRVELENYDNGGAEVAYSDSTPRNDFGAYRTDGVDLEANSSGYHLAQFFAGEWQLYSVTVAKTARYRAMVRVASAVPGGVFRVEIDGQDVSGRLTVPNTGGWTTWQGLLFEVNLTAGNHDLKVAGLENSTNTVGAIGNIDWIEFTEIASAPQPPTPTLTAPTNGATFASGSPVTLTASLAGDTSTLARVEFLAGTSKIGERTAAPWSINWSDAPAGTHNLTAVTVTTSGTRTTSAAVSITVTAPPAGPVRTPYQGSRQLIPGRVEMERYDEGGANLAYSDSSAGNDFKTFRSDDVDIESNAAGYHLASFYAGEWLRYSVNVQKTARYLAAVRVASNQTGGTFRIEIDGTDVSGSLTIPNTSGWTTWQQVTFEVDLNAGDHDLRIVGISSPLGAYAALGNIDAIDFVEKPANEGATPVLIAPAAGSTFDAGTAITIAASVVGNTTNLARVEFFDGSLKIGQDSSAPFSISWLEAPAGDHQLSARAVTSDGASVASAPVSIKVRPSAQPGQPARGSVVNVRNFGATPDDATDDTLAIRDALAAIGPVGGTVYLPAGTYRISPQIAGGNALTIDFDDVALRGDGADKSVLSFRTLGGGDPTTSWSTLGGQVHRGSAIGINGTASADAPRRGVSISALRITGNATTTGNLTSPANTTSGDGWDASHHAIAFAAGTQISGVRLEALELDHFRGEIVSASGATNGLLEIINCRIHDSNAVGVAVSADLRMINNEVYDHAFACVVGEHLNRAAGQPQHGYYLSNTFEPRRTLATNGLRGLVLRGEGDAAIKAGLAAEGLFLVVQNNVFKHALQYGLLADKSLFDAIIERNEFIDNGASGDPQHGHLALIAGGASDADAAIEGLAIRRNAFSSTGTGPSGFAILLNSAGHVLRDIEMLDNTLTNPAAATYAVRRFLLLASASGETVGDLVFTGNKANSVSAAVEDLTRTTHKSMRPRYADNDVTVTGFTALEDDFAVSASSPEIYPSWARARVVPAADRTPITLQPYLSLYPDFTEITLTVGAGGKGVVIAPDANWNYLASEYYVAGASSVTLVKRGGRFEVRDPSSASSLPTPPPVETPPPELTIQLTAPAAGASIPAGTPVHFETATSGDASRIARVAFFESGVKIGEDDAAPYQLDWNPPAPGAYNAQARIVETNGHVVCSPVITFRVCRPPASGGSDALTHEDIGGPGNAGSSRYEASSGIYTVEAGGADIWQNRDQFHFAHQSLEGDGDLVVRVLSLAAGDAGAKVGLMIRASLSPEAAHASVFVSSTGVVFQRRRQDGGTTITSGAFVNSLPLWLRLRREGSTFTAFYSTDGAVWTTLESDAIAMPFTVRAGFAATAHSQAQVVRATFDRLAITSLFEIYNATDIGLTDVLGFGSFNEEAGTFTVGGSGRDIWGRYDAFNFVHRTVTGAATIMTRVDLLDATHPWAKAGLMVRADLSPDAANVLLAVTPENGVIFQHRMTKGDITAHTVRAGLAAPVWLALERHGSVVTGFVSSDGDNWEIVGSVTVEFAETVSMGMAVTSRVQDELAIARFTDTGVVP